MSVIDEIAAERRRQIDAEGYSAEHDDQHGSGELLHAAVLYFHHAKTVEAYPSVSAYISAPAPMGWPWDVKWWKPKSPRRDLIRAGALAIAERDRLQRLSSQRHIAHVEQKLRIIVAEIERLDRGANK